MKREIGREGEGDRERRGNSEFRRRPDSGASLLKVKIITHPW